MSKLTPEEFREYLKTVRALAEGPFEEMQKEARGHQRVPQNSTTSPSRQLYRYACPKSTADGACPRRRSCRCRRSSPRGPGGMRMHLHYAADLNWRILDDYGKPGAQGRVHGQVPGQDHLHELRADRADRRHRCPTCTPPPSRTRTATTC